MCCFLCIRRVYRAFTTHLYCAAYYTASLLLYRFGFPAHLSVRMNYIQSFDCIEITKRFLLYASTATNTLSLDVHSYSYTIGVQISICFLFLHCYLCVRYSHNNICAIESMERRRCVSQPSLYSRLRCTTILCAIDTPTKIRFCFLNHYLCIGQTHTVACTIKT